MHTKVDGTNITYHCLRFPMTSTEYKKAFLWTDIAYLVVNQRKYNAQRTLGCIGSRQLVRNPPECCSFDGVTSYWRSQRFRIRVLEWPPHAISRRCLANVRPGVQLCINTICGTPTPGVSCGKEGLSPLKYRCCRSGVPGEDKFCHEVKKDGICTNHSGCLAGSGGKASRC